MHIFAFRLHSNNAGNNSGGGNVNDEKPAQTVYPLKISTYNYAKEPVEITFEKPPEKIIAVYQNSIETLLALGLEDRILACSGLDHEVKYEYKEAFSKVNYLTDFAPSKENVVMMEPDFILIGIRILQMTSWEMSIIGIKTI